VLANIRETVPIRENKQGRAGRFIGRGKLVEPNLTSGYLASRYSSRPRSLRLPTPRFRVGMRLSRVALAVALFIGSQLQSPEMFPQGVAQQSGTVSLSALRGLVGSV